MIFPTDHDKRGATQLQQDGLVTFRVAGQWLGIPVILVQEVLSSQCISPVPLSGEEVAGFLNLRGQIVTAVDLRIRLGLPRRTEEKPPMNVVVRDLDELFSLVVDEVGDVLEVSGDRLEEPPPTLDAVWRGIADGVVRLERGLLVLASVERLLREDEAVQG
jgi:purine-binding chemotaxis protein CheW